MAPLDLTGFRRGHAWNKRHEAQHRAQWAYFGMQSADEPSQQNILVRSPSIEEVPAPTSCQSSTRRREDEEVDSARSSERGSVKAPSSNLAEHYRPTPKDAVPLFVPKYDQPYETQQDWKPDHREKVPNHGKKSMGWTYKPRGGVRPGNTLNRLTAQSARKAETRPQITPAVGFIQYTNASQQQQHSLQLDGSRGSNVYKQPESEDDLVTEQSPSKKLKGASSPVDLTGDEGEDGADLTQGQPVSRKRQVDHTSASQESNTELSERPMKKRKHGGDAFGNNELYDSDANLTFHGPRQSLKFVSHRVETASSRQYASQNRPQTAQHQRRIGTARQPVDLDDNDVSTSRADTMAAPPSRSTRTRQEKELPIDLMNGVNEAGEEHRRKRQRAGQGSAADLTKVNDLFTSLKPAPTQARSNAPASTKKTIHPPPSSTQRAHANSNGTALTSKVAQHPSAVKLQKKYERDVEEIEDDDEVVPVQRPSKAQPSSSRPRTRDSSPDMLDGGPTIRPRQSQVALSPRKLFPVISSEKDRLNVKAVKPKGLTSSLQQTNFERRKPDSAMTPKQNDEEEIWNVEEDKVSEEDPECPAIITIICKGFTSTGSGHRLFWDPNEERFLLVDRKNSFVYSPLQRDLVEIGKSAVTQGWLSNKKSLKVILKGSMNWMSNGNILLEFATLHGKDHVYQALCDYAGMKLQDLGDTDLNARFTRLGNTETDGFLRAHEISTRRLQTDQLRRRQNKHQQPDVNKIIYESAASQPRQQKLVNRMQGMTPSDARAAAQQKLSKPRQLLQQHGLRHSGDTDQDKTLAQASPDEEDQKSQRRTRQQDGETSSPYFSEEPTRKSTRQSKPPAHHRKPSPELEKYTEKHGIPKWAKPVVYPKQGALRVTIDASDVSNLDLGEFLNDNILNYRLRDIEEKMTSPQKDRVHFFNTFFYSSLTAQNGKRSFNYDAVKKWTKNVDLFSKPYVVVPINLDLHWFVAIIYNLPAAKRKLRDSDGIEEPTEGCTLLSDSDVTPANADGTHSSFEKLTLADDAGHDENDRTLDVFETIPESGQAEHVEHTTASTKGRKGKKGKIAPVRKFTADQPMIISLDSFGYKRGSEIKVLKRYIVEEAREKRQIDVSTNDLQGVNAQGIPQQSNFYDCGVYLLGYIEEFVKDPDRFVKRLLGREVHESDFGEFDTSAMRNTIREDLLQYGNAEDRQYRDEKARRGSAKKTAQTPQAGPHPAINTASTTTPPVSTEVSLPPMSSQPTRNSPSAQKLDSPTAQGTLSTSTEALRGPEIAEAPASSTLPGNPQQLHEQVNGPEDDLEVDVPHTLPKAPRAAGDDNEMLMQADTPDAKVHERRSAAHAGREAGTTRDMQLSPLSSLTKDLNQTPKPRSVGDSLAGTTGRSSSSPQVEIKHEDESGSEHTANKSKCSIKEETPEAAREAVADAEIKSESDESGDDRGPVKVIDIGDEGDKNIMDDDGDGFENKDKSVEIPESQEAS